MSKDEIHHGVAIVGMAIRCPGARHTEEFWDNLCSGTESISFFDEATLAGAGIPDEVAARPGYVSAAGALPDADCFDAEFFGFTPREAQLMDPQHRVFLECGWAALEDSGQLGCERVGVYAGVGMNSYLLNVLIGYRDLIEKVGAFQTSFGNDKDFVPTRLSYKLGLTGPSLSVQTACSTSLVAVHLACQSLLLGECDVAIAGGGTINVPLIGGYQHTEGGILSPDGHCRAFDAEGRGTVPGSGVGVVVLKRLADAIADNDTIRAVIRGSALNNDGAAKAGFTAPSTEGQAAVIAEALVVAGVEPDSIGYVEAHGTGTALGDPIEVAALMRAFGDGGARSAKCPIGSVKTNIGHLDTAAGVAALIKVALAVERDQIPPSLHYRRANPQIDFERSPFFVNTELARFASSPRRAGVSSFGIGGTNAHLVLEEPPTPAPSSPGRSFEILPLSGRTPEAVAEARRRLADHLERHPELDLADVAFTLQTARRSFAHRDLVVCSDREGAVRALRAPASPAAPAVERDRPCVFLLPGQGAQYVDMALGLYRTEPVFRDAFDQATAALARHMPPIAPLVYPQPAARASATASLTRTEITQPALFCVEYALASLWRSWGVTPRALIGHSLGELVAACLAGVFSLADAALLVARRGQLMQSMEAGAMLAVSLPEAEASALLGDALDLAAVNGPEACVIAGPIPAIADLQERLVMQGRPGQRLSVSHAFHSRMMEPALAAFEAEVQRVALRAPSIPFVSNVTGTWITAEQATDPGYWRQQMRAAVRFGDGLATVLAEDAVLLEVGPGGTLGSFARRHPGYRGQAVVGSLRRANQEHSDEQQLMEAVGRLWQAGTGIDWRALRASERRRRVPLPTYPFARVRHWLAPVQISAGAGVAAPVEQPAAPIASAPVAAGAAPSEVEQRLVGLWRDLLGVEVQPGHDFFSLGGDSLLATQLVARVREQFAVELPLRAFLQAPTVSAMAEAIAALARRVDVAPPAQLVPDLEHRHEPFPLTDVQQAYLIGRTDVIDLGNVGMHGYMEVDGDDIDLSRLTRALRRLVGRHDMLRAVFSAEGEQRILPSVPAYEIAVEDLRGRAAGEVERALAAVRSEMSHQVFDPGRWPLFELRATLLDDRRTRLHVSVDGLITDAWATAIITRETMALYRDPDMELPALALSFRDYVLAERALREGEAYRQSLAYWKNRVATLPPAPELPQAAPLASLSAPRFTRRTRDTAPALWSILKERAARAGLTTTSLLLTAYARALSGWSKSARFTLNVTVANRLPLHPEVDALVGDFTSVTLLEVDMSGNQSFSALAQRVHSQLWTDLEHRAVSGVEVVRELARTRGMAGAPAMPVVFTSLLANTGASESTALGTPVYAIAQTPQVMLDFQVYEEAGGLHIDLDAIDAAFPDGVVDGILGAVGGVLEHLATAGDDAWTSPLPGLLPPAQAAQRARVNATGAPVPPGLLHDGFRAQVEARPDAVAIIARDRTISYLELHRTANRIAHWLRERGARPGQLVAVVMDKGWEQVAAVLGVLRSGAAYLPIEAALPVERIRYLLAECGCRLALTQSWHEGDPAWPHEIARLSVDHGATFEAEVDLPASAQPGDLAYVIFTSGSTGRPKGVMIEHRGALNTVVDCNQRFHLGPEDRTLALSSLSFDLSVYDVFGTLAAGGAIVMPGPDEQREPAAWARLMRQHGVGVWNSVPALMEMFVDYLDREPADVARSLRLVMLSGDWIPVSLPGRIWRLAERAELVSLGGATEASIWSILYPIDAVDPTWTSIPYGRPMVNQTMHVLNDAGEPCPLWVTGHIHIGGIGLARGYWNDEEKTSAAFVINPRTGERLYRTGDLGRYLPSGDIEFLGREDSQVKIQGHRIELGEIEAALLQHPAVAAAAAMAVGDPRGRRRLAAAVVLRADARVDEAELQELLRERLPAYMVPGNIGVVAALPLSANGKVDRKALAALMSSDEATPTSFVAPRTPLEERLVEIVGRLLGGGTVGVHDDFFDLGGDSLLATRALVQLKQIFGVELSLRTLFERPTVAQLAEVVEELLLEQLEQLSEEEAQALLNA